MDSVFLIIIVLLIIYFRKSAKSENIRLRKSKNKLSNLLIGTHIIKITNGKGGRILHFFIAYFLYFCIILIPISIFVGIVQPDLEKLDIKEYVPLIFAVIFGLPLIDTLFNNYMFKQRAEQGQAFGKARFAREDEVRETGLTGRGIIFGKLHNKLITKPPTVEGHTLVIGGTGTGKTRGVVLPSLFSWRGSALVIDIKGEISAITAEHRSQFSKVYIFSPEKYGHQYNPIAQIKTPADAQELARTLIPLEKSNTQPFWTQAAQAILAGAAFEASLEGETITDVAEKLCTQPIEQLVNHFKGHYSREVRVLASIAYDMPEKTLGGVMGELKSKLITLASDPEIRKATQKSDWTPETLEEGSTIYLQVSEHLLEQYKDLWTLIISQILRHLAKREEKKQPPILIVLDEMPRLAELKGLTNALATLRSRNVHIMAVIQSMAQLDDIYGIEKRKVIADNCRFKFVLSATDPDTQKYFSDLAGHRTVKAKGSSIGLGNASTSESEQGTPLIRPEEWANLEKPILFAPKLQPLPLEFHWWDKHRGNW